MTHQMAEELGVTLLKAYGDEEIVGHQGPSTLLRQYPFQHRKHTLHLMCTCVHACLCVCMCVQVNIYTHAWEGQRLTADIIH